MICVAVTRIKNEADIIESFVRHHAQYFDTMIISDDGSNDDSCEIIDKLRLQGFPLILLHEPWVGFEQSQFTTRLMHKAFDEFDADWVAPLDADEFIELPESATLADVLPHDMDRVVEIAWNNFIWSRAEDSSEEINPVLRLRWRFPSGQAMKKVLIPAAIGRDESTVLWTGNHGVNRRGEKIEAVPCDKISLCHYPIRSAAQFTRKVIINYLQFIAAFGRNSGMGFQYDKPFDLLRKDANANLDELMERLSRTYSPLPDASGADVPKFAPLRYLGGPLEFTSLSEAYVPHVLTYAEALADRVFALDHAIKKAAHHAENHSGELKRQIDELRLDQAESQRRLLKAAAKAGAFLAERAEVTDMLDVERALVAQLNANLVSTQASHATEMERVKNENLELGNTLHEIRTKLHAMTEKASLSEEALREERVRVADLTASLASTKSFYAAQTEQLEDIHFALTLPFKLLSRRLGFARHGPPR